MSTPSSDPFELSRFVAAQKSTYAAALQELRAGQKCNHWMWYIFPQAAALGSSPMAKFYAIRSREEANAYLEHPLLGARLCQCTEALLAIGGRSAEQIMGYPDFLKLQSSITLFAEISPDEPMFAQLLEKYFSGRRDQKTIDFLS